MLPFPAVLGNLSYHSWNPKEEMDYRRAMCPCKVESPIYEGCSSQLFVASGTLSHQENRVTQTVLPPKKAGLQEHCWDTEGQLGMQKYIGQFLHYLHHKMQVSHAAKHLLSNLKHFSCANNESVVPSNPLKKIAPIVKLGTCVDSHFADEDQTLSPANNSVCISSLTFKSK